MKKSYNEKNIQHRVLGLFGFFGLLPSQQKRHDKLLYLINLIGPPMLLYGSIWMTSV